MTPSENTLPPCRYCGADCKVGYGFCHCECGLKTNIATMTSRRRNLIKGLPSKYLMGHGSRIVPVIEIAEPFRLRGAYCRLIPLTQRQYAIVWESDYYWLMQWKWFAHWNPCTRSFYAARNSPRVNGKSTMIWMHRLILGLHSGDSPVGDHIESGETTDNCRDNLRIATASQNCMNRRISIINSCRSKGVHFHKVVKKWCAQIQIDGVQKHLGYFDTREEAHAAYCAAAILIFKDFARFV